MSKKCCFAGHGKVCYANDIYDRLQNIAEKLIIEENVTEFLVGNYGNFDALSAKAVRCLKQKYPDVRLTLVIPYLTADVMRNDRLLHSEYDEILMADMPENTPGKLRILKCNEYMVKNSGFMICYVEYGWGGAAKTLEYAGKMKINVFNLATGNGERQ